MVKVFMVSGALLFCAGSGVSQGVAGASLDAVKPKFAVASVKECNNPKGDSARSMTSLGGLRLGCWQLKGLIQQAYDVFRFGRADAMNPGIPSISIEGLPSWASSDLYSIDAKTDSPQTAAMMRGPMMQALLEERFRLQMHSEKRETPVYLMTLAEGPLKLRATRQGSCMPYDFSEALNMSQTDQTLCAVPIIVRKTSLTILDIHGTTLATFAKLLHPDGRPVIDHTGLGGSYDIHLEWDSAASGQALDTNVASDPATYAPLLLAMRNELGLQLSRGRATIEVLIVDHIEKVRPN